VTHETLALRDSGVGGGPKTGRGSCTVKLGSRQTIQSQALKQQIQDSLESCEDGVLRFVTKRLQGHRGADDPAPNCEEYEH